MTPLSKQLLYTTLTDKVPSSSILILDNALNAVPEEAAPMLISLEYKNPIISIVLSLFLGIFGIDRFYVKSKGLGITKLLLFVLAMAMIVGTTFGLMLVDSSSVEILTFLILGGNLILFILSIWTFVDIFLCYKQCKKYNFSLLSGTINQILRSRNQAPQTQNQAYNPNSYYRK